MAPPHPSFPAAAAPSAASRGRARIPPARPVGRPGPAQTGPGSRRTPPGSPRPPIASPSASPRHGAPLRRAARRPRPRAPRRSPASARRGPPSGRAAGPGRTGASRRPSPPPPPRSASEADPPRRGRRPGGRSAGPRDRCPARMRRFRAISAWQARSRLARVERSMCLGVVDGALELEGVVGPPGTTTAPWVSIRSGSTSPPARLGRIEKEVDHALWS